MSINNRGCCVDTLLTLSALSTGYGDVPVLHDVELVVNASETVVLLGPNGHGKSTLLRTISGLHKPWSGSIVFDEHDITAQRPDEIVARGLVQVPQGDLLFSQMSVLENLLVGAYLPLSWRDRHTRLEKVWTIFPSLGERSAELTRNLSGGERRMVALGRALMGEAKLLMIDEPSLGLAPIIIEKLYDVLDNLKQMGMAILLVEEAAERVCGIADRVYLLDSGRIVKEGPADSILQDKATLEAYLG